MKPEDFPHLRLRTNRSHLPITDTDCHGSHRGGRLRPGPRRAKLGGHPQSHVQSANRRNPSADLSQTLVRNVQIRRRLHHPALRWFWCYRVAPKVLASKVRTTACCLDGKNFRFATDKAPLTVGGCLTGRNAVTLSSMCAPRTDPRPSLPRRCCAAGP